MAQFKTVTLEVYHLNESMAMLALKYKLHPSHLTNSLDKRPAKSYLEMLAHVQKTSTRMKDPFLSARLMESCARRRLEKSLAEPRPTNPTYLTNKVLGQGTSLVNRTTTPLSLSLNPIF